MTVSEMSQSNWSGRGRLDQLVSELERQRESAIDFVADSREFQVDAVRPENGKAALRLSARPGTSAGEWILHPTTVSDKVFPQVAAKCSPSVPTKFLRELVDAHPELGAGLVNDLFAVTPKQLVRILDDRVRAYLGGSYQILDNYDLAWRALDTVKEVGGEIIECSLSDTHMRLKFTSREIFDTVNKARQGSRGDWYSGGMGSQRYLSTVHAGAHQELPGGPGTVHPLVTISNSETGHGGLNVRVGILRAICFNLATVEDVISRAHRGGKLDAGIYSHETRALDARVMMGMATDAISSAFNVNRFSALVAKCNAATEVPIENVTGAMDNIVKVGGLTEDTKTSILQHFLRDYDANAWGLAQAVSRTSQDVEDGDTASDLEALSGQLIKTPAMVLAK